MNAYCECPDALSVRWVVTGVKGRLESALDLEHRLQAEHRRAGYGRRRADMGHGDLAVKVFAHNHREQNREGIQSHYDFLAFITPLTRISRESLGALAENVSQQASR